MLSGRDAGLRLTATVMCVAVVVGACSLPAAPTDADRTTNADRTTAAQTAHPSMEAQPARPTNTPPATPLPLPTVDLGSPQTWFAPNMGSVDFPQLFSQPGRWKRSRAATDVFQFYGNAVSGDPFDIGGDNVLDTFIEVDAFRRLHDWGIATSLELGVIKWFACAHGSWADYTVRAIGNVEANGGRVSFVAMDEPLLGSLIDEGGTSCGYSTHQAAQEVAAFMAAVRAAFPDVRVGTIETMPPQTPAEIEQWLEALEAAGAQPAFLHLDVEVADGIADPAFAADIARLRDFSEAHGIPFGLILTADWQVATSDAAYHASVVEWASAIRDRVGRPTHLVFQSWMGPAESGLHEMPRNLPEDDPAVHSHTRLILDGLAVLDPDN